MKRCSFSRTVFHHLGRLLATFYLYDEAVEIKTQVKAGAYDEKKGGAGCASAWRMPIWESALRGY